MVVCDWDAQDMELVSMESATAHPHTLESIVHRIGALTTATSVDNVLMEACAFVREDTVAVLVKSSHDVLTIVLEMESALEALANAINGINHPTVAHSLVLVPRPLESPQ